MQRGLTLVDLAKRIEENKALKADFVHPARDVRMTVSDDHRPQLQLPDSLTSLIRPVAHDQIGAFTGIPAKYYDRMAELSPTLLADNVNEWLGRSGDRRMIRTLAGDARAFLSDRYQRIENEEIANTVLPILMNAGKVDVVSCEVTERRLYIFATFPDLQREVKGGAKVGDVVQAGVAISNSEVGLGSVDIAPLVYRLVCLNGAKIPDRRLRKYHVGGRIEEGTDLNAIFADDTRAADDKAILLKVRDVVRSTLDETAFAATVDRMSELATGKITGDPTKAVGLLAAKVGATDEESGGILRALIEGADLSAWGMLNAVTFQAHNAKSYDRSAEFVDAGGKLLALPKSEWKEILEAA